MPHSLPVLVVNRLLDVMTAGLQAQGFTLPSQVKLTHGPPAVDPEWEYLAVYWKVDQRPFTVKRGPTAGQFQPSAGLPVLGLTVELWRNVPAVTQTSDTEELAAEGIAADDLSDQAWAIWTAVLQAHDQHRLFEPSIGGMAVAPTDVGIGALDVLPPKGLAAGWKFGLEVNVPSHYAAPDLAS